MKKALFQELARLLLTLFLAVLTITAWAGTIDLSQVTSNTTTHDGDVITGTLANSVKISIAAGATVTLQDMTINVTENLSQDWAGITCEGSATIILEGTNFVNGFNRYYPGIQPGPAGTLLTIRGNGSLTAKSGGDDVLMAPGIGQEYSYGVCGDITIESGTIIANGGCYSAGIGSSLVSTCGNITITGGDVTATCVDMYGPGIGSGFKGTCGNITISGGNISATGANYGAGIGTGMGVDGDSNPSSPDPDAHPSTCGIITITGGTINATGGKLAAGIGTGDIGNCGNITIDGGNIAATKGSNAQHSIGRGFDGYNFTPTSFTVTIGGNTGFITDSPYTVVVVNSPHNVTLKEGTADADKWAITPGSALRGESVVITYSGNKKIKSIKAVRKVQQ